MTRTLEVVLVTLGDPRRLTGGYLFHRRLAGLAAENGARLRFGSFPERPFPLAAADAVRVFRTPAAACADALVIDSICAALAGPYLALGGRHPPVVGMLHQPPGGIDFGPLRSRIQARLDLFAYRRARLLMVASDDLGAQVRSAGVPAAKLRVVPPGRDVAPAVGPAVELRRGRRTAVLCVGNWMERKGIHSLLDAFAALPEEAATLHLVGDTSVEPRYAAKLRARLSRPDLSARVVVHGALSLDGVAAMYAAADVFALPSLKEPFGTVYGEAMAFGLPVVGWRAGNLPHLATDGVEGFALVPGDVQGLAGALRRLCDDEPLRRRMRAAALRRARVRPNWKQTAALFFDTIREALARGEDT